MSPAAKWSGVLLLAGLTSLAHDSRAEQPKREVAWNPAWPKFSSYEYAVTGTLLAATGVLVLRGEAREPTWRGPILFDEPLRDAFRGGSPETREGAQLVGDALYYGGLAYPYLVDVMAVTWLSHGAGDVAAQMALMNTEAFAITGFLSFFSNAVLRRERPYMRECTSDSAEQTFPRCDDPGPNEGFYSGHTGIAFAGAALTCSHHQNLPLYGSGGVGGAIVCAATMTGAVTTGAVRIISDQHYVSDVIAGSAIGLLSGFLVPLLHYRAIRPEAAGSPTQAVSWFPMPWLSNRGTGLAAVGSF